MSVLYNLLNDLLVICRKGCLIKPIIRFPLFIQLLICFLNFSSVSKLYLGLSSYHY